MSRDVLLQFLKAYQMRRWVMVQFLRLQYVYGYISFIEAPLLITQFMIWLSSSAAYLGLNTLVVKLNKCCENVFECGPFQLWFT